MRVDGPVRFGRGRSSARSSAACLVAWLCLAAASRARAVVDPGLTPDDYADESRLAAAVWERSPEVIDARQESMVAASEETRAHLLPNPQLDLAWGTIPVGPTNPRDLNDPIGNVPNYSAGLSELIELGKRGPRQAATGAEREAATWRAVAVFADRYFELLAAVGKIAMAEERANMLDRQVGESERLLQLEQARADKGEIAKMQSARTEAEHMRLVAERDGTRSDLEEARAACAELVAQPCAPFGSEEAARAFLVAGAGTPLPTAWSDEIESRRPDLAALAAAERAADERVALAKHQAIPDVTLRLGYTYDTFVVSGNQRQSLGVGMQMPLPVADHGQADEAKASATLLSARRAREALSASGRVALAAAVQRRALIADRLTRLDTALAKADELRTTMSGAAREGGVSEVDVLLARRRYQEVLLDRTQLDYDAYAAALAGRQAAALFPAPDITLSGQLAGTGGSQQELQHP
jgi:cobalt-zinc-cadmium efflux system outer membrane protein